MRKLAKVFEMVLTSDDPNSQLCIIRSEEELNEECLQAVMTVE